MAKRIYREGQRVTLAGRTFEVLEDRGGGNGVMLGPVTPENLAFVREHVKDRLRSTCDAGMLGRYPDGYINIFDRDMVIPTGYTNNESALELLRRI